MVILVNKKENKYPNVIDFLCDSITGKYTDSEDYLRYKSNSAKKAAEMEEKLRSNKFTLQDFYEQMVQMTVPSRARLGMECSRRLST